MAQEWVVEIYNIYITYNGLYMAYILLIYGLHMAYIWLICGLDVGEIFWTFWENHTIRRFYVDFTLLHTNHGEYPPQPPALPFPNNGLSTGNPWIPTPRSHQETANSHGFLGFQLLLGCISGPIAISLGKPG